MFRNRSTTRWKTVFMAIFVVACTEVAKPTAPPTADVEVGAVKPKNMWVETTDPCFWTVVYTCHEMGVFSYSNDETMSLGDSGWDCPQGCTTYPLGTGTKRLIQQIMQSHIKGIAECNWVLPFLQVALSNNRIRHYGIDYGDTGDAHWDDGDTDPAHADIHIKDETFLDTEKLGKTLIHEAAHVHFQIPAAEDYDAEAWADGCYKP